MARVFTTRFNFNHQMYDAIVTVTYPDGQMQFTVRVMDPELHQLLPEGHLNYTGKDGFKHVLTQNHLAEVLIQSIAVSVEEHLSVKP